MEGEGGAVGSGLEDLVVDVDLFPLGLDLRFQLGEVRLHGDGEVGVGEVEGVLQVHLNGLNVTGWVSAGLVCLGYFQVLAVRSMC